MKQGDELQIKSNVNNKHQFFYKELVRVTSIATDGIITAESEESGEWELTPEDYIIL